MTSKRKQCDSTQIIALREELLQLWHLWLFISRGLYTAVQSLSVSASLAPLPTCAPADLRDVGAGRMLWSGLAVEHFVVDLQATRPPDRGLCKKKLRCCFKWSEHVGQWDIYEHSCKLFYDYYNNSSEGAVRIMLNRPARV